MHVRAMGARARNFAALVLASSTLAASGASAGGHGGGAAGGGFIRHAGGFHGGGFHGGSSAGWGGGARFGGGRALPPVSGVIHEGPGSRPYFSAYGHTNTAAFAGGFARGGVPAFGRGAAASPNGGYGGVRPYGHVDTGFRSGAGRRFAALGSGRRRLIGGRVGFLGGYGGYGGSGAGYGGYGFSSGVYGGQGTYGQPGTYGGGAYGGDGTTATQGGFGGGAYLSETPLAASFAEPALAPSPYAPYSPGDRYAYAASADVGPGPRVVNPYADGSGDCACGPRRGPVVYRYGVGTAY